MNELQRQNLRFNLVMLGFIVLLVALSYPLFSNQGEWLYAGGSVLAVQIIFTAVAWLVNRPGKED